MSSGLDCDLSAACSWTRLRTSIGLSRETKHWVLDGERGMGLERQRRGSASFEGRCPAGQGLGRGWGEKKAGKVPGTLVPSGDSFKRCGGDGESI